MIILILIPDVHNQTTSDMTVFIDLVTSPTIQYGHVVNPPTRRCRKPQQEKPRKTFRFIQFLEYTDTVGDK